MRPKRVGHVFDVLLAKQRSLIAEETVQFLGRERQERGEHHLERVDGFERGVDRLGRGFAVGLDGCPRRGLVEVLVDGGGEFHRFAQRRTQAHGFEFCAHSVESVFDDGEQVQVNIRRGEVVSPLFSTW